MNEHQRRLVQVFHRAPIADTMGMRLRYDGDAAVFEWAYQSNYDHAFGDVHGGVIATMLDNAGFFAAAACYETWIVTVEFQTRLLEPAQREDLVATGRVIRHGRRIATASMELHSASGRLIALGSGSFVPTRQEYPSIDS